MSNRLYQLGRWTAAHRIAVTVTWVLLLLGSIEPCERSAGT